MAEQMRPASPEQAPDPSNAYERSHPSREAGMGRLDNNVATPAQQPDRTKDAVPNRQRADAQLNAHDVVSGRSAERPGQAQPEHSMHDEEPLGWDQAPTDIDDPRKKRHPRTEGRGGTP